MTYKQIEDLLFEVKESKYILEGHNYTEPFMCRRRSELADIFYIYVLGEDNTAYILGYIAISPISKDAVDWIIQESPMCKIKFSDQNNMDNFNEYKKIYELVHSFAYKDNVEENESKLVLRFLNLLPKIMSESLLKFYHESVPEFFEWAKQISQGKSH